MEPAPASSPANVAALEKQREADQAEIGRLRDELAKAQGRLEKIEHPTSELETFRADRDRLKEEVRLLRKAIASSAQQMSRERVEWESKREKEQSAYGVLADALQMLRVDFDKEQERANALEVERESLREEIDLLQQDVENLRETIRNCGIYIEE